MFENIAVFLASFVFGFIAYSLFGTLLGSNFSYIAKLRAMLDECKRIDKKEEKNINQEGTDYDSQP